MPWTLGRQMKLSHHCLHVAEKGTCSSAVGEHLRLEETQLEALRVVHSGPLVTSGLVKPPLFAETRLALARGGIERDTQRKESAPGERSAQVWVWQQLWRLGLNVNETSFKPAVKTTDQAYFDPDPVIAPIVTSIPSAAQQFRVASDMVAEGYEHLVPVEYSGHDREATLIDPKWIRQLATFAIGDRTYWLVQSYFTVGTGSGATAISWPRCTGRRTARAR